MLLDGAADAQLWRMLQEAGAAEVIFEIHMRAKDAPPARAEVSGGRRRACVWRTGVCVCVCVLCGFSARVRAHTAPRFSEVVAESAHAIVSMASLGHPPLAQRLLHTLHKMQKPLGRAAAGFVAGLTQYESAKHQPHPLISPSIRADL